MSDAHDFKFQASDGKQRILSLQGDSPVLNSFRILSGQVVDTEHHL